METIENQPQKAGMKLERTLGIILLIPPTISVLLFTLNLLSDNMGKVVELKNLSSEWTGGYSEGGGYTSAAPIYLGLMAIAGAWLLKGTDKK